MIDLRSDTVTKPTEEMLRAMIRAEVGDDVFGEDPTINALQDRVADMLGHAAGLWVASGTMGNAVALRTHCQPGDEIVAEATSHIFEHEVGGAAALSGALIRPLPTSDGLMRLDAIQAAVRSPDVHHTVTRVIALENTHNFCGGAIYPLDLIETISTFARTMGIAMHLDGARLWNAHAETGIPLASYGRLFDSVTVCLSKGLGAPAGSVLVGSRDFIARARRFRKMFGGGMRQVGLLAATGMYALDRHLPRLRDDHENAREFARICAEAHGIKLPFGPVQTNIVFLDVAESGRTAAEIERELAAEGVGMFATAPMRLRAVTHLQVSREQAVQAAQAVKRAVERRTAGISR